MAPWSPGDAWPSSTPGGALSPHWGGYVKLFVRAALAAGEPFRLGPDTNDRLDAGYVLGGSALVRDERSTVDRLWVDLACDALDVQLTGGATSSQGIFSKPDAATAVITLADPEGIYDPLSPVPPWSYGGVSRLVPGTPVEILAEVVDGDDGTVSTHWLFTGTADSWGEDWTPKRSSRQCTLVASDETKRFARFDRPEVAAVGAGDTTAARVQRIVDYYAWPGTVDAPGAGTVTLQSTTLAQNAWELLNRALDDELGYIHLTADGKLRWLDRSVWLTLTNPVIELGCETHDVLLDVSPSNLDRQLRNAIYAARTGGSTVVVNSPSSIGQHGEYGYKRTDLGLETDVQVNAWATLVLQLYSYPQVALKDATFRPAIDARSFDVWNAVLALAYVSDLVRVVWAPPDMPTHEVDVLARVVGASHVITRTSWEMKWQLVDALAQRFAGSVFTAGPHAQDRLDSGFVLGYP